MQLELFPGLLPPAPLAGGAGPPEAAEPPGGTPVFEHTLQSLLFSAHVELTGILEQALLAADFAEARCAARELRETYGEESLPSWASVLEEGPLPGTGSDPLGSVMAFWARLEEALPPGPLRDKARRGVLGRLVDQFTAREVAARFPARIPEVVNLLRSRGDTAGGRGLLRDALLAGCCAFPGLDDPQVLDLLSEDLDPPWLVSLGLIRHLWAPVPLSEEERAAVLKGLSAPAAADGPAAAREFWLALCLAESRPRLAGEPLHAVRRRLRLLNPDLHAAYLQGAGPFA